MDFFKDLIEFYKSNTDHCIQDIRNKFEEFIANLKIKDTIENCLQSINDKNIDMKEISYNLEKLQKFLNTTNDILDCKIP